VRDMQSGGRSRRGAAEVVWIVMLISLLVAAAFQGAVPECAVLGHAKAPALLGIAAYYALGTDGHTALFAGLAAGTAVDVMSPSPLGYAALCYMAGCWIIGRFRGLIRTDSVSAVAVAGAVAAFVADALHFVLLARSGLSEIGIWRGLWHATGSAALGAVVTPVACAAVGALDMLVGNVRRDAEEMGDAV